MEAFNEYKTKDLAEASALLVCGKNLISMIREGSICFFIFKDKVSCEKLSNEFFFGKMQVNARDFYETMVRLKSRIFQ